MRLLFHRGVMIGIFAMSFIVLVSNVLVQFPINDWLTWGAFTYPVAFLVTDLTNRALGSVRAKQVVCAGFALAVLLSVVFATPRIAVASGAAFLVSQLVDVHLFERLRERGGWWTAPLLSSGVASVIDTGLFFSIAFAGLGLPWITWAVGDFAAKLCVAIAMLLPFRVLMRMTRPQEA